MYVSTHGASVHHQWGQKQRRKVGVMLPCTAIQPD